MSLLIKQRERENSFSSVEQHAIVMRGSVVSRSVVTGSNDVFELPILIVPILRTEEKI